MRPGPSVLGLATLELSVPALCDLGCLDPNAPPGRQPWPAARGCHKRLGVELLEGMASHGNRGLVLSFAVHESVPCSRFLVLVVRARLAGWRSWQVRGSGADPPLPLRDTARAMSQENVEIVRAAYKEFAKGNLRDSLNLYDPLLLFIPITDFPAADHYLRPEGLIAFMREYLASWDELHHDGRGTHRGGGQRRGGCPSERGGARGRGAQRNPVLRGVDIPRTIGAPNRAVSGACRRPRSRGPVGASRSRRLLSLRDTARAMSDRRTAVLKVVFALIAGSYALLKVAYTLLLAFLLWYGIYLLAGTECGEPDCSWLADNVFTGDRSAYLLVVCVLVAVGLVWGIPAARRRRDSRRAG